MNSFSTPDTGFISKDSRFGTVYPPSEDTFLLLDALEHDWRTIELNRPARCLEMGCGSGVVSCFVAQNLRAPCSFTCVDLNEECATGTQRLFGQSFSSTVVCDVIVGDLASSLIPVCDGFFDLILFNPPYVVTSSEEVISADMASKAWAGGLEGREVMDRFFPQAVRILSSVGLMYCVVVRENRPDEIKDFMARYGFHTQVIKTRKCRNEELLVLRFSKGLLPA